MDYMNVFAHSTAGDTNEGRVCACEAGVSLEGFRSVYYCWSGRPVFKTVSHVKLLFSDVFVSIEYRSP